MTELLVSLVVCLPLSAPLGVPQMGIAKHYSPGIMAQVAKNRTNKNHWGYVPGLIVRRDVAGYISRPDCSTIGRTYWVSINGRRPELMQQLDCSQDRDRPRHLRTGLVVELDYSSAVRNGFARAGKARARVWQASKE